MRYDRMIETILALPLTDDGARMAAWRQLVDIVAQAGDRLTPDTRAAAHERIAALRAAVPVSERRRAAASVAGRTAQPDIVAIFATDEPAVAAPVLARATLGDAEWLVLLPTLPAASRAILRNRRDLTGPVDRALGSYGLSDFALPAGGIADGDPGSQIRNLVARIEAFRSQLPIASDGETIIAEPATDFVFETTTEGIVDWADGTPREPLLGLSLADAAPPRGWGVDGQAAGAFRRRAPFNDARLLVPGNGIVAGDWLISAAPIFNPRDGRFAGYHGTARRPRPGEQAGNGAKAASGASMPADSLRQLVHELRTPLNAIQGFAEMIDRQILGPTAAAYRARAQQIVGESRRLLEVVEDLDTVARLDSNRLEPETSGSSNTSELLRRIARELQPSLVAQNVTLDVSDDTIGAVAVAPALLQRMVQRLIATTLGLATSSETIRVRAADGRTHSTITVTRPEVLLGRNERTLLDPGFGPDGEWPDGPILGLGFTLRLIANLAREAKSVFTVTAEAFVLTLPLVQTGTERLGEQG